MSSWHSHVQSRLVTTSRAQSRPVTPSHTQWQQVSTGVNRWHLVAVRSHSGLRLDGRINPARASNRPGRRIKGGGLLPGWVTPRSRYRGGFAPTNPPPVLVIVSDILDSEIHDWTCTRVQHQPAFAALRTVITRQLEYFQNCAYCLPSVRRNIYAKLIRSALLYYVLA